MEIQELAQKSAHREPKPALEMGDEDHALAGLRLWHDLEAENAALGVPRHLAVANQLMDLHLVHHGAFPGNATSDGVVRCGGSGGALRGGDSGDHISLQLDGGERNKEEAEKRSMNSGEKR